MTQQFQNQKPVIGATLERPQDWVKRDGFVNGYKPNQGGNGGTVFIGTTRTVKRNNQNEKENHTFFVKVWGNDAMMLEAMANHNAALKAQGQQREIFMVNFSSCVDHPNVPQGETQYPMSMRGNTFVQVDPKSYQVIQTADNFAAQQAPQQPANQEAFGGQQQQTA